MIEEVILNKKEQKRLMVLNKLERREMRIEEAAQLLSLSVIAGHRSGRGNLSIGGVQECR